jgi:hypothetical protein
MYRVAARALDVRSYPPPFDRRIALGIRDLGEKRLVFLQKMPLFFAVFTFAVSYPTQIRKQLGNFDLTVSGRFTR